MLRSPRLLIALILAPVLLLTSCTAVQRRPGAPGAPGTPGAPGPTGTANNRPGARAGAMDPSEALAAALDGNGATRGVGASTLVLGNTAFIAYGNGMTGAASAPGRAGGPNATGAAGLTRGPVDVPGLPGDMGTTGATGVTGANGTARYARPGTLATPPGGALTAPGGATAAPGGVTTGPGAPAGMTATPAPGGRAALPGATVAGTLDSGALSQVVTATLPWVREIRVANDPDTANRLRSIAAEVRAGRPVSDFLDELATLSDDMTRLPLAPAAPTAPGAAPGPATPGVPGAPAPAGGAPRTTAPPAPGGAAPGR